MDLLAKRSEIVNRHKTLAELHPHWKAEAAGVPLSGNLQRRLPPDNIAERPIAFLCDREVIVVGDCVQKVYDALRKFWAKRLAKQKGYDSAAARLPWLADHLAEIDKALQAPQPAEIRVRQSTWAAYSWALGVMGMKIVLTDGLPEDELVDL